MQTSVKDQGQETSHNPELIYRSVWTKLPSRWRYWKGGSFDLVWASLSLWYISLDIVNSARVWVIPGYWKSTPSTSVREERSSSWATFLTKILLCCIILQKNLFKYILIIIIGYVSLRLLPTQTSGPSLPFGKWRKVVILSKMQFFTINDGAPLFSFTSVPSLWNACLVSFSGAWIKSCRI